MKPPAIFREHIFSWLEDMLVTSLWCRVVGDSEGEQMYGHLARTSAWMIGIPRAVWITLLDRASTTFFAMAGVE